MAEHYFQGDGITLYAADAEAALARLATGSVDCVVTRVPRWRPPGGSDRHQAGGPRWRDVRLGREPTPPDYADRLRGVFAELRRVVRDTGTVWLNVGAPRAAAVPAEAAGMPWRVVFALQRDDWILRNAVVWRRSRSAVPVAGRLSPCYETLFLLTKKPRYYFNFDSIRERSGKSRVIGDVWPSGEAAGADLPVEVAARCVAVGCPAGGVVLDPFSGSAASGVAARGLGCTYVGIDVDTRRHIAALCRFGLADIQHRSAA